MSIHIRVDRNDFPRIAEELPKLVSKLVRAAALNVEHRAKDKAPVDTGFLKNSLYTVTSESSGYANAAATAASANGHAEMLSEEPAPEKPTTAVVAVGASYGLFVEYGSSHGPAQPYLEPALHEEAPAFEQALRAAVNGLEGR